MNCGTYPSIAAALAAERRGRFMVEADHGRRLAQVHQVRGLDTAAARFMGAIRDTVMTGAARLASWGARRRLQQGSRLGQV